MNMDVYTGKPAGSAPEKNQAKRVVLDPVAVLQGHNITCDNFFAFYARGQELPWKKN